MRHLLESVESSVRDHRVWLVALVRAVWRRLLARAAGLEASEIASRWPLPRRPGPVTAPAPPPALALASEAPPAAAPEPAIAEGGSMRRVSEELLRAARPSAVLAAAGSPIPPNVERAVKAQLHSSHRTSLKLAELARFLEGLGVSKADAAAIVQRAKGHLRREDVAVTDLAIVQSWVTEHWVSARAKKLGADFVADVIREVAPQFSGMLQFQEAATVLEQVDGASVTEGLMKRGWSEDAAGELAERLLDGAKFSVTESR